MSVTITTPSSQEEIPAVLKQLREELAIAQAKVNSIRENIEAVQKTCNHITQQSYREEIGKPHNICIFCLKHW